jgi:DNA-binding NarL/FixJ family response regulator
LLDIRCPRRFARILTTLRRDCVPPRTDIREVVDPRQTIRCVLAHDHVLLRQGLRRLLEDESDIEVVAEAGNAAECLRKTHELQPDVIVAGAGTFGLPAPEAELRISRESPQTRVVFVSRQEQASFPFGDAAGYAVRETSAHELVQMVRNSGGGNPAPREESGKYPPQRHTETTFPQAGPLTPREREVLKLLAEGNTVRMAATILGLSSKTVDAHKFNLMRKLGIHNKAELVMWAIQKRVVKIPANF